MNLALLTPADPLSGGDLFWVVLIPALLLIGLGLLLTIVRRYKRCPSNKVLVIYGRTSTGRSSRTLHGGGAFVWPLIQDYEYLNLDPVQIEIPLENALSAENIRISVPSVFTVAIGTDAAIMNNAAVRLLGLKTPEIMKQAEDIIFGQLRQVIAGMQIQDINRDRDQFLASVQNSLEPELAKIGLVLINVNIKDITDESGYIRAIGQKAAAEAIQSAQIDVADQERRGAIGVAEAERERAVQVANAQKVQMIGTKEAEREQTVRVAELLKEQTVGEQTALFEQQVQVNDADRDKRIRIAEANARAVEGENESKAAVARTNADLRIQEAEAFQRSETRKREADAAVLEAQYLAEAKAAEAQAKKLEAEKRAQLEAVAKAEKATTIVDAEAAAAKLKIDAEAQAAAIYAKLEAEARGQYEILAKKGDGLKQIVESCGGPQGAFQMLMLEHIDNLSKNAAQAISNIKFDKVVVWDGGGKNGEGATSNFLQNLGSTIPPMLHMMRDIGGVEMPDFFGKLVSNDDIAERGGASKKDADGAAKDASESKGDGSN
ncbi:Inner membrane protein YqiK [Planctomycetes bacterium Pla163]|uniref:Inner membrane protein YqiK n=1 Tax=Rohdeia mirabilis TaxID=2528008 RepID=A0A518D3S6_9BACT|nr:Inner membrane protein YqiK [Planctomycetes bacterium Pla163]